MYITYIYIYGCCSLFYTRLFWQELLRLALAPSYAAQGIIKNHNLLHDPVYHVQELQNLFSPAAK